MLAVRVPDTRDLLAEIVPSVEHRHQTQERLVRRRELVRRVDDQLLTEQQQASGGPGDASEVPAKFIVDHLFGRNNIALASAASVVMLVTVFTVLAPLLYWRSKVQARLDAGH